MGLKYRVFKISLRDRIWLWWNNYCPKHVERLEALPTLTEPIWICRSCQIEKKQRFNEKLKRVEAIREKASREGDG